MVVTGDAELAERSRWYRDLCFGSERFVHDELGWNMRVTNLQAAIGLAQLERLDATTARKRRMGRRYHDLLQGVKGIQLPPVVTAAAENVFWVYGLVLDDDVPFDAREAMRRLSDRKIGTRPFFWPLHEQPVFRRMGMFADDSHPVAERIARRGFYIPSGVALTDAQMDRVVAGLKDILS